MGSDEINSMPSLPSAAVTPDAAGPALSQAVSEAKESVELAPRSEGTSARSRPVLVQASLIDLLGVNYAHIKTSDDGDLYLTQYGQVFWEHLLPENWYAKEWFEANRERLVGTSTVYRVPTRRLYGMELNLVVKWSRVGEDVPLDTLTINKFISAEFNSPFEEFSLLMELRAGQSGPPGIHIKTQKPLAIYVPSKRLQIWQTGRSEYRIAAKLARHPGVELDILRHYVVLYGWIKGLDITEVADRWGLAGEIREMLLARATSLVMHELELKGYRVVDMKPAHVIVRLNPDGSLLRDRNGQVVYALIDYELLERTPEHEQAVRSIHRQRYLQHMARRFEATSGKPLPAHLKATTVLGVDYIFGHAESTGGSLWVAGKDPDLFNYFLPERWRRTPKESLSNYNQVFKTRTKDNINLVWRVSRLGDTPWLAAAGEQLPAVLEHGYNSPFEEFAYALELSKAGVRTIYPRAIYMTGHKAGAARTIADHRRYTQLGHLRTADGEPAISEDHEYITIWGFWNGPDELLALHDGEYYRGINADQACQQGLLTDEALQDLLDRVRNRLSRTGFEDLNLKPTHLLISFSPDNKMALDTAGKPEVRLCNFELVRRLPTVVPDTEPPVEET
jgi:hypothetical protein